MDTLLSAPPRFTARLIASSVMGILLCASLLLATTQQGGDDLPLDEPGSSPGAPPPAFFGLTYLTPNHVARLHYANPQLRGPLRARPSVVRLEFVDRLGRVLLRRPAETVMPGEMTSLDLVADGLDFPPGSYELGVRAQVTFLNPQARGLTGLQLEDTSTGSSAVLVEDAVKSPFFVKELQPLCTSPLYSVGGSVLRVNVANVGSHGFPGAQLSANLVIYSMRLGQQVLAQRTVLLNPQQSDSLSFALDETIRQSDELFGTVEFIDSASQAVAAGTYEFRAGSTGIPTVSNLHLCFGPRSGSSTSGGGATNSGGCGDCPGK